jgi:hypothetical protein
MNEKRLIIIIVTICLAILGYWVYSESKPKPGIQLADEGREHVQIGTEVQYGTNPPTSGNHYAQWTKWGVYDTPKDDRNLVHSLEHGYVIMHYNCDVQSTGFNLIPPAFAQTSGRPMEMATESAEQIASAAATLSDNFKSDQCKQLVNNLTDVYNAKGQVRLLVVPRPKLDSMIALTAWRHMEKMNSFDKSKIEEFIKGHINQGPEKTME